MSDLTLSLGDVIFDGFEVPDQISGLGGEQMLVIHKLPGGRRVVDSMGRDDAPIEWSGRFRGQNALARARQVDAMRVAGDQVELSFGEALYTVVVRAFHYSVQRVYEVPYSLVLEVITDETGTASGPGVHEMILGDNDSAQALGASVGDGPLSGFLSTLDGAISSVSNFAKAAQSTINGVLAPIAAVQGRINTLIASADNTLNSVVTVGGVVPNNPLAKLTSGLNTQVLALTRSANLYDLQSVVGRMAGNLSAVGASGAQVTMAGGDLYHLAEQSYGDAGEWATIAKANGLTDPVIAGVRTILVPPAVQGVDGLLQP